MAHTFVNGVVHPFTDLKTSLNPIVVGQALTTRFPALLIELLTQTEFVQKSLVPIAVRI
jgi:hypothetical protein